MNVDTPSKNNLKAGEVSVGVPATNTRLHFLADGTMEIIYNGVIPSQGIPDYLTKFTELQAAISSFQTALNLHVHTSAAPGSITTSPVTPMSIDISASKYTPLKVSNS